MDAVLVVDRDAPSVRCDLIRNLQAGDRIVCGVEGISVQTPETTRTEEAFAFMSAGVSSERRVERVVEELALEMKRIRSRGGRIVVVAGPVVIHTGGGDYLAELIRNGYVQALLTGNALPTHDIELNMFGTSLGVDMKRGTGAPLGHQYHLRAINRIRRAGSIAAAVEQGLVAGGVMYECIRHGVEFVAAGSIRDDGPLPETIMDLCEAQAAYARAIEGAKMILLLSSMLHAIGVGNMTPAGVRLICVDINPAVATKLADRGSVESTGVVTDVGLFLNLLAQRLRSGSEHEKL
jgi:lysine-ketoglutarate reductase/saccharopine dehydrogenase-like protein (TIGR00300 family)